MVLQRGQVDALGALAGALFLLALGLVLTTVVLVLVRAADTRLRAASIAAIVALAGLALVGIALGEFPWRRP